MKIILGSLIGILFISTLQIILIRYNNHLLFIKGQKLQQQHEILMVEWNQLQQEQSTWTQPSRIKTIAHEQLGMNFPKPPNIVVIKP